MPRKLDQESIATESGRRRKEHVKRCNGVVRRIELDPR
jgi:hypothetical protein